VSIDENQQSIVRAFAYAWKYRQMYEEYGNVKQIIKSEKMTQRTIYRYLNLSYLSPKIINEVMGMEKKINIKELLVLAPKYDDFQKQENHFD
jgi:hypothetical protein